MEKQEIADANAGIDPLNNAYWLIEDAIFGNVDLDASREALLAALDLLMAKGRPE